MVSLTLFWLFISKENSHVVKHIPHPIKQYRRFFFSFTKFSSIHARLMQNVDRTVAQSRLQMDPSHCPRVLVRHHHHQSFDPPAVASFLVSILKRLNYVRMSAAWDHVNTRITHLKMNRYVRVISLKVTRNETLCRYITLAVKCEKKALLCESRIPFRYNTDARLHISFTRTHMNKINFGNKLIILENQFLSIDEKERRTGNGLKLELFLIRILIFLIGKSRSFSLRPSRIISHSPQEK